MQDFRAKSGVGRGGTVAFTPLALLGALLLVSVPARARERLVPRGQRADVFEPSTADVRLRSTSSIWARSKLGNRDEEREEEAAIERVLLGYGDERDLMRVRVALITLSRGEVQEPRAVVWLVRLRREMGLMPAGVSTRLLEQAVRSPLSHTERAWAHLELAHLALRTRDLTRAQLQLGLSLDNAWQPAHRAEAYVLRGFVHQRAGEEELALLDFRAAHGLAPPRRVLVEAHLGEALVYAVRGDAQKVAEAARAAHLIEAGRASVSRLEPFWDLSLTPLEQQAARAILLWGKGLVLARSNPDAAALATKGACTLLIRSPQAAERQEVGQSETQEPTWGVRATSALAAIWQDECDGLGRQESGAEQAEESPSDGPSSGQ